VAQRGHGLIEGQPGIDCMRPFRLKFTDKALFGQIQVSNYNIIWLLNNFKSKIEVYNAQLNLILGDSNPQSYVLEANKVTTMYTHVARTAQTFLK
jgi:hypothetical protein